MPRSALGAETRLSGQALGRVLHDLADREIVLVEADETPGLRGPKQRYRLNKNAGRALSIGFSYDRIGVSVTDLTGSMLDGGNQLIGAEGSGWVEAHPEAALSAAARCAVAALTETNTRIRELVGIGISFPGPIFNRLGPYHGSLTSWHSHDIIGELIRELAFENRLPVELENDSNLLAVWEHRHGAARDSQFACVVQWGAGLGAGLIIDGQIYVGPTGLAGEVGHVHTEASLNDQHPQDSAEAPPRTPKSDEVCERCGQRCVETLIGTAALLRELEQKGLHYANIAAASKAADGKSREAEEVRDLFRRAGYLLGHKLAPILSSLNLQLLVIDTFGDPDAYPLISSGLRDGLRNWMFPNAFEQLVIRPAECGPTGSVLGAIDYVLDRHLGGWAARPIDVIPRPDHHLDSPAL